MFFFGVRGNGPFASDCCSARLGVRSSEAKTKRASQSPQPQLRSSLSLGEVEPDEAKRLVGSAKEHPSGNERTLSRNCDGFWVH